MNVSLLFLPEFSSCDLPYLGLPCLTAYLRAKGYTVRQRDLNVKFMEFFLSPEGVDFYQPRAIAALNELNRQSVLVPLEQRAYSRLVWPVVTPRDFLVRQVAGIRKTLTVDEYYDSVSYGRAMRILNTWYNVLEGLSIVPGDLPDNVYRFHDSSRVLEQVIDCPDRNPYYRFLSDQLPEILADRPDLIGMSLVVPTQILPVFTMGLLLKENLPETPVVIGGNICTRLVDILPGRPDLFRFFDVAVLKEGEGPLLALAEAGTDRRKWSRIPNLIYRDKTAVRVTPQSEPVDINDLPTPDFSGLPLDHYLAPMRALPLYSCRGCYWARCAFCNIHVGYARFRPRSAELVVNDMAELTDLYGAQIINFVDEAMPVSNLSRIADGVTAAELDVDWTTHARFEPKIDVDLALRLRRSGCTALYFGLEAGSKRVLELMDRGIDLATASRVLQTVHDAGIITHMNIIVGFPGETEAEARESIDWALAHGGVLDSLYVTPFVMGRWTPVAADPARWGVSIHPSPVNDLAMFHQDFFYNGGDWLPPEQAEEFRWRIERDLLNAYPAFGLRFLGEALPFYVRRFRVSNRDELLSLSENRTVEEELPSCSTITLAPDTLLLEFPHDFPVIRRLMAHPQSRPGPIQAKRSVVLYNVKQDKVFTLSPSQSVLVRVMLDKTVDEAAAAVSRALNVTPTRAATKIRAFAVMAREFILFPRQGGVRK